jgi:hypothetical protein
MSAVASLSFRPLFVFLTRRVVSLLLRQWLVAKLPNDPRVVGGAFRASSRSPFSGKRLPAVALEERLWGYPRIDLAEFHILSFVVPCGAFKNLQLAHPIASAASLWGMMARTLLEVKHRNRIAIGYEIILNN